MKILFAFIFSLAWLFFPGAASGQGKLGIQTAGKRIELAANVEQMNFESPEWTGQEFQGKLYALLLFDAVPLQSTQDALQQSGLTLLSFMPVNAYLCRIPTRFSKEKLISFGVKAVYPVQAEWKISQELSAPFLVPERALKGNLVRTVVVFSPDLKEPECTQLLKNDGFAIVSHKEGTRLFEIGLPFASIKSLASRPYVEWIEAIPPPEVPNNLPGVNTHRAGILNSSALGQRNLKGEGVTVGVGDGGYVRPHMDFNNGRLVNMFPPTITSFTDHGDHVAGTVGGAGF
jgi:subtilisin family serine protease